MLCPFMHKKELLLLSRNSPEWFAKWVELEDNKILAHSHVETNLGVWGEKRLPEILEEAILEYGHMSTEELLTHRFSHGHCVQSKY